jgi:asparagine synthase (glutamine-hydrolysing)
MCAIRITLRRFRQRNIGQTQDYHVAPIARSTASEYSGVCSNDDEDIDVCGFAGGTNPQWNYSAALESIAHRGPDASSLHLEGIVKAGFRRLSIIDLAEEANQPMFDGDTWLVFNGEIYGFQELRRELEKLGQRFRTQSDTEVVLRAYLQWNDSFVEHIDGMFAIVIWDSRARLLKMWRDRPGIKPLYYHFDGRHFAFASELKAIESLCGKAALQVDGTALYDFLSYRYVPGSKTMYRNCYKLLPGHSLVFEPDTTSVREPQRYWCLPIPDAPAELSLEESCEELRHLVTESVREQMIADVPLGFFLSGGVDSSVVVAAAASMGSRISTFSIGFDSDAKSETPYARQIAEAFGTDHHERILTQSGARGLLPSLKEWFDEPFADESAMPTWLVARTARENVTVVLTGDGGDEVFGGYRTYPRFARYNRLPAWPLFMDNALCALRKPFSRRTSIHRVLSLLEMAMNRGPRLWGKIMFGMSEGDKRPYRHEFGIPADYDDWWHYREHWRTDLPLRTRLQYLDFHTFMPGLVLTKVDRTTMAVSLEARVPLLAKRIIEFSFSVDESIRYHNGELKGLLKHAYRGILPDSILDRRKKGFGIPRNYLGDLGGGKIIQENVLRELFLPDTRVV